MYRLSIFLLKAHWTRTYIVDVLLKRLQLGHNKYLSALQCLFCKNIPCQQEAISSTNGFFTDQNFLKCHQTSKIPSRRFGSPLFFVRQQNPLFLDGYPSLDPLISRTIPIKVPLINVSGCNKNFACLRYEQGFKNEKLVITNFQIFCKRQTLIFVVLRRPKED